MVITEVVKNLKVADVASDTQSAVANAPQQAADSTAPVLLPSAQRRSLQRIGSAPSRGEQSLQRAVNSQSSRPKHSLLPPHHTSMQSVGSDAVRNPLLLLSDQSRSATSTLRRSESNMQDAMLGPSKEMKSVAKQITVRCLRRWDGILGIRAGKDGLGRRFGIWRDKFDGVRYAVLLLAMRKLNQDLIQLDPQPSESI